MPDVGRDYRIIGFLCNWCSYGGADAAGTARFSQPTDLRIIRVPCSGRVDPMRVGELTHRLHTLKAGDPVGLRGPLGNHLDCEGMVPSPATILA